MAERFTFDEQWPALSRTVRTTLLREGVPSALVDDVVQETGIRLWRNWQSVDPDRSPARLAKVIARNVVRDHMRSSAARHEVPGDLPERAETWDAERQALARAELSRVGDALSKLRTSYRDALLGEVGIGPSGATSSANRMTRLRARRELLTLVQRSAGVYAASERALVETLHRARVFLGRRLHVSVDAWGAGVLAIVAATTPLLGTAGRTTPRPELARPRTEQAITLADQLGITVLPEQDIVIWNRARRALRETPSTSDARKNIKKMAGRVRLGRYGGVRTDASLELLGRRVGSDHDGAIVAGCVGDRSSEASDMANCKERKRVRGNAEVRYRVGDRKGHLEIPVGD